jgi:poly(hydroxyalkanoate) depolymerase family esterase
VKEILSPLLREATRLTRAGRLSEATTLLRRLVGDPTPKPTGREEPDRNRSEAAVIDFVAETNSDGQRRWTASDRAGDSAYGDADARVEDAARVDNPFAGLSEAFAPFALRPGPARPAAEAPADPGRFVAGSYANGSGSRPYKLYVPTSYAGEPVPLIVMLHGCTQTPDDFAAGTRMNALAEAHRFLVLYPDQPVSANQSRCWNWFDTDEQQRGRGEPSLIAGMTRRIMQEYRVDPRRVYAAGLSAGGAAAAILGATYPDLFAAIGVHSGLACGAARDLPSAFSAMKQGGTAIAPDLRRSIVPTIVFHGDKDRTVHRRNGDQVMEQALAASTRPRGRTETGRVPGGHAFSRTLFDGQDGQVLHEQWLVHSAGHAWFGGSPAGSYTDPLGPDASREMLRFFLEHPRKTLD